MGIKEKIPDADIKNSVIIIPWHDIIFYNELLPLAAFFL
jgi:hypothetical protein